MSNKKVVKLKPAYCCGNCQHHNKNQCTLHRIKTSQFVFCNDYQKKQDEVK